MQGLNLRPTHCNVLLINCLAALAKEGMHKYTHNWPRTQIGSGWPMRGRGSVLRFARLSSRWSRRPGNPLGPDEAVCPVRSGLAPRSAGLFKFCLEACQSGNNPNHRRGLRRRRNPSGAAGLGGRNVSLAVTDLRLDRWH